MKYFNIFRDIFLVYDRYTSSGYRISEAMVLNILTIISSILVVAFGIDLQLTDTQSVAIAGGIYALLNVIVRLRSKGGESKIKREIK